LGRKIVKKVKKSQEFNRRASAYEDGVPPSGSGNIGSPFSSRGKEGVRVTPPGHSISERPAQNGAAVLSLEFAVATQRTKQNST
jgi:hypothetical protein